METLENKLDLSNTRKTGEMICNGLIEKSKWRKVEYELPEKHKVVLVCIKFNDNTLARSMAYRVDTFGKQQWSTDLIYEEPNWYEPDEIEVTHWMPLPDLPGKEVV